MKSQLIKHSYLLILFILISGCATTVYQTDTNSFAPPAYNIGDLTNYGEWVQISKFGQVWRPYVVEGWMPYENGHWAYSEGNWTWVSYEPFGWIVYHYGNWYDDVLYGWVWVPSNDPWSPARVVWIDYNDYVGWAPLPPAGVTYVNPWEVNGNRYWHVVKQKDFMEDNVHNYFVDKPTRSATVTRNIGRQAPTRTAIETSSRRTVTDYKTRPQTIKLPNREIKRMNLPPQENKKVEQNTQRVRKDVLVPRDQFRKQENARNQQQQKERKQEPKKEDQRKR